MNYSCEIGFVCWNTDISIFFQYMKNFVDFSCFLVRAFEASAFQSLLEEGFPTAVRKPSRLSDLYFTVLIKNVGFKPMFKPVSINLDSSSSFTSFILVLVDCFWSHQNYFHLNTLLNIIIVMSMSAWVDFQDGSGTNRSNVTLQTRCTSSRIFSILEAWARPWAI